jgi:dTDP-glucose 4,6-dehydratase
LRVLVSGGAGFVPSHLCDRLLQEGHEVVAVDNFLTGRPANLAHLHDHSRFQFVEADVTQPLTGVHGRFDFVLHLASPASPVDYLNQPIETMMVGSIGTKHLLDLALVHGAGFLFSSTSECYGDPTVHPQTEAYWGHVNPVGPRAVYDEAKRFGEALVMAYHRKYGLRTRIARIFNTYGPRMKLDDGRVVPQFLDQALRGLPLTIYGDGTQTRSFCYVSDLVDGLHRLMYCDEPYPVNLGNPNELTILEFAERIRRLTGASSPLEFHPLPEDDPKQRQPDITKARTLLGWEPQVPLEEGLRLTIQYFVDQRSAVACGEPRR